MRDTFDVIYRILQRLEQAMDEDDFDWIEIDHTSMEISERRWLRIIEMMLQERLLEGFSIHRGAQGDLSLSIHDPRITLKGLEYLADNSSLSKVVKAAKLLKDTIPGL